MLKEELRVLIFISGGVMNNDAKFKKNTKIVLKDSVENYMANVFYLQPPNGFFLQTSTVGIQVIRNDMTYICSQVPQQVINTVKDDVILISELFPDGTYKDVQLLPNMVMIICDNDLLYGATLRVEYTFYLGRRAIYGDGGISEKRITDNKDPKFAFSEDEKLITEDFKTNKSYGWKQNEDGKIITENGYGTTKLILTSILGPDADNEFENTARGKISYNIDSETNQYVSRNLFAEAMKVTIVPATGKLNIMNTVIVVASALIIFCSFIFIMKKVKRT